MRRVHIFAALFAATVLCAFSVTLHAQSDGMKLDNAKDYGGSLKRGIVIYNHDKHTGYGFACTDCHHKYDPKQPGKNLWEEGDETDCAACHSGPNPKGKIGLEQAFHKMCWGCHEKQPKSKQLAYGPRSCAGCHEVK